jgi:hypothetical protein
MPAFRAGRPSRYTVWRQFAESEEHEMRAKGIHPTRIVIDAGEFVAWCLARNLPRTAAAPGKLMSTSIVDRRARGAGARRNGGRARLQESSCCLEDTSHGRIASAPTQCAENHPLDRLVAVGAVATRSVLPDRALQRRDHELPKLRRRARSRGHGKDAAWTPPDCRSVPADAPARRSVSLPSTTRTSISTRASASDRPSSREQRGN